MNWSEEEFHKELAKGNITLHDSAEGLAGWIYDDPQPVTESDVDVWASLRGKANRQTGFHTETMVKQALENLGFTMVVKVENTWRIIRIVKRVSDARLIAEVVPAAIEGDYRAIGPDGKSVLVEVKARKDSLPYSALQDHQHNALNAHYENGGISLLAWVDTGQDGWPLYIMSWPIPVFKPRTALSPDQAQNFLWHLS